jgi:hypothetical protein
MYPVCRVVSSMSRLQHSDLIIDYIKSLKLQRDLHSILFSPRSLALRLTPMVSMITNNSSTMAHEYPYGEDRDHERNVVFILN